MTKKRVNSAYETSKNSILLLPLCGCGEIGRRTRLRIWRRKACRFDPYHPHQLANTLFFESV